MALVTPLAGAARQDRASVGGKGAVLGELLRADLPVPEGFVVTSAAYAAYVTPVADQLAVLVREGESAAPEIRALFERPMPTGIAGVIEAEYARWGDPEALVAVRSSATGEDLPTAFPGQQDTFLGVSGAAAVVKAVRRCWASLWTERAMAARADGGGDPRAANVAVVVQRLVHAEVAGVLFTANPANGRPYEAVLHAVHGLGEVLARGEVTPDEIVVADGAVIHRHTELKQHRTIVADGGTRTVMSPARLVAAETLSDAEAVELAEAGRRIEEFFGAPQEIAWALEDTDDGRRPWIVRARRITALPPETGPVPTGWPVPRSDGVHVRIAIIEQLPDPLSPLLAGLIRPAMTRSLAEALDRSFGALRTWSERHIDVVIIHGYAYCFYSRPLLRRLAATTLPGFTRVFRRDGRLDPRTLWRDEGYPA